MKYRLLYILLFISHFVFSQPLNNWLTFDGTDDYVSLSNSSNLKPTSALTVELWAFNENWASISNARFISNTQYGGYNIEISSGNIIGTVRLNGSYRRAQISQSELSRGWHHFAITCDGRYTKLYIDGTLKDTDEAGESYPITYHNSNCTILGAEAYNKCIPEGSYFNGVLDEVRIWSIVRTEQDILDNKDKNLSGTESGLVGYWQLDETSGSNADDQTSNNNGELVNMGPDCWTSLFIEQEFDDAICSRSDLAWGDYNNDNYIDFVVCGLNGSNNPSTKLYKNNGDGTFTIQSGIPFYNVEDGNVAWGDYNNDGYIDLLLTGKSMYGILTRIYKNDKNGGFDEADISFGGKGISHGSAIWGDYNNDGLLDFFLFGSRSSDNQVWKTMLFKNKGNNRFEEQTDLPFENLTSGCAEWGDFNNDSFLDLYISGYYSSTDSYIYKNNCDGTFSKTNIPLTGVYSSSAKWGDINNDGYMDLVITGNDDDNDEVAILYKNNGNETFTQLTEFTGIYDASICLGDYDNNGYLDLLLEGTDTDNNAFSAIYKNNGDETFSEQNTINIYTIRNGVSSWCDYDNDGDLDILQNGSPNGSYSNTFWLFENKNLLSNTPPNPPSNLSSIVSGTDVTFRWDAATDDETSSSGLKYKLCIGSSSGKQDLLAPMSNTSTGFNRVPYLNKLISTTSITIKDLPENSNIYWSVQTVDPGLKGSNFTSEENTTLPVEMVLFEAVRVGNSIKLNWETATEVNNYGFDIELSVDNSQFSKIGFITGHGNSNSPKLYQFLDESLLVGNLKYRLKQINTDGSFTYSKIVELDLSEMVLGKYKLYQNYPNPFNPTTNISYSIPTDGKVDLIIYDLLGNEVASLENSFKNAGNYSQSFDASKLTSGLYFYKIKAGDFTETKKMLIIK